MSISYFDIGDKVALKDLTEEELKNIAESYGVHKKNIISMYIETKEVFKEEDKHFLIIEGLDLEDWQDVYLDGENTHFWSCLPFLKEYKGKNKKLKQNIFNTFNV